MLRNDLDRPERALRIEVRGDGLTAGRDALGAVVRVRAGGRVQRQEVRTGRGYLSQSERVLTFGLGSASAAEEVTIQWPGSAAGGPTVVRGLAGGTTHRLGQAAIQPAEAPADTGWFREVAAAAGIDHVYRNGQEAGHLAILESLGGGVAVLDADGDGRLDLFFTGGGGYAGVDGRTIVGHPGRLYRNEGDWKFRDITAAAGLDGAGMYTHGAAAAGLRTEEPNPNWTTSAAWGDVDGDGRPDLYVCRYVDWSFAKNPRCSYHDPDLPDVCPPRAFEPLPDALYRNNGDGTFTDIAAAAGLLTEAARGQMKGLGVVMADLTGDGRNDLYVANDTTDNLLFLNQGGTFVEAGRRAGVARDDRGVAIGSMGLAVGDPFGTGLPALFVTNYQHELPALYRNDGAELFTFASRPSGVAAIGLSLVGFGTALADFDRDGHEDIVVTNGHVIRHPRGTSIAQPPALLRNLGGGRFAVATPRAGEFFRRPHHGRGLAVADLDDDGRKHLEGSRRVTEPEQLLGQFLPHLGLGHGGERAGQRRPVGRHRLLAAVKIAADDADHAVWPAIGRVERGDGLEVGDRLEERSLVIGDRRQPTMGVDAVPIGGDGGPEGGVGFPQPSGCQEPAAGGDRVFRRGRLGRTARRYQQQDDPPGSPTRRLAAAADRERAGHMTS